MIQISSVTKTYRSPGGDSVTALAGVSLAISRGEFVAVVGPSGSGKSTLLFTIGGLLRPDAGEVLMDEKSVYGLSSSLRARLRVTEIGFVFQTFNLVPYLSCLENVALPARLAGRGRREADHAAEELLSRLGLSARVRHRPAQLSVGERQRVAVARAMVNGPRVLIADEPTANLDPGATVSVMELLLELSSQGQAILMVTHDRALAKTAHRVLELSEGRIATERGARPPRDWEGRLGPGSRVETGAVA